MSCIVAINDEGTICMAADSLGSNDYIKRHRTDTKLFHNGEYLIGACGHIRTMQLVMPELWKPPKKIVKFVDKLRKHFFSNGCVVESEEGQDSCSINLIIGHKSSLYEMHSDFQIAEYKDDYTAIGSGSQYALGSLYTTARTKLKPPDRLEIAMRAAAYFSPSVGGEIIFEYLPAE